MTSEVRELKNFTAFPGKIIPEKGWYEFPTLYKIDKKGNLAQWQIIIRLVKHTKNIMHVSKLQNWNLFDDTQIPTEAEYLEELSSIPGGTIAQIWVEKGIEDGVISRFPPSYANVKNVGRANERNALMSALISARDKYIDMHAKGYVDERDKAKSDTGNGKSQKKKKTEMTYPMLAVKFKEKRSYAKFPGICQPKIDGVHCVIYLKVPRHIKQEFVSIDYSSDSDSSSNSDSGDDDDSDNKNKHNQIDIIDKQALTPDNVIMYSRSNKDFPGLRHMRKQILPILLDKYDWARRESIYLDGELYKHGLKLQQVTSLARNEAKNSDPDKHPLEFWMFDCFYPSRTADADDDDMVFKERYALLTDIFSDPRWIGKKVKAKRYAFDIEAMTASVREIKTMIEAEDVPNFRGYKDMDEIVQMINLLEHSSDDMKCIFKSIEAMRMGYFVLVPNCRVESFLQFEFYYQGLLSAGFEGAMFRNINGEYITNLGSDDSRRSTDLQKHKPTYTREFPVVGYTSGKGTNAGAIIWVCQVHESNIKFNVVPKNTTLDARKKLYQRVKKKDNFNTKYKGRLYTLEYEDISEDGAPLRAKGLEFRDID